ncbi:MAG TPA: RimK family protein [Gemmatimonadales bacterium]|nr:RimK family protein [Gemmatimonadales bacterium]
MKPLVVIENTKRWHFTIPDVDVVSARAYLTEPRYAELRRTTVYNLCRRYGYQGLGYYVSLLAAARGHKPMPSVATIQALQLSPILRIVGEDLDDLIQRNLAPLKSESFELSIYFGRNLAKRYDRLSRALFNQFPAPFLRASFVWEDKRWKLQGLRAIATSDIPEAHQDFVIAEAARYFAKPKHARRAKPQVARYDLAILWNPLDENAPSWERSIKKFIAAGQDVGIAATVIGPEDYGRIAEFDALFIREVTSVDHHTFRFAQRAATEGLIVVDDPESIIRCSNKVYQAELFDRYDLPCPKTMVVHEDNVEEVAAAIGFPCVVKLPDSSFSQGVIKIEQGHDQFVECLKQVFEQSDLAIVQEWLPTGFDWRIGVLNREVLYVCKYHMARGHWQIISGRPGRRRYGKVEAVALEDAPARAVELGVKAASLVGDGLYGVDVKEIDGKFRIIEINDNPSIDAGYEDTILGDQLYLAIMQYFRTKLDERGVAPARL